MSVQIDPKLLMMKAAIDETTLPNSVMNRQQADRFIDLVIDSSRLLKNIRTRRINHPKGEINKLNLGNIVTEAASISPATTSSPTDSTVKYDTEKARSAFDLVTDFVEDNLEGAGIRNTLLNMFSKRIAVDLELLAIEGDETIVIPGTVEENLLGLNDGFIVLMNAGVPAAQKLDAQGTASSKQLFHDMKRKIPVRFRVSRPDYRWQCGPAVYDKWELDTSNRATSGGDAALEGNSQRTPFGIPLFEIPLMPEDLTYGTGVTDGSKMWLSPLANLIWFIQRDITIEWDRQPRADAWEVTIHTRSDIQIEDTNMIVLANNLSESGVDYA